MLTEKGEENFHSNHWFNKTIRHTFNFRGKNLTVFIFYTKFL